MLGGFIAAVVAVIVALVAFLSNLNIFSDMASMGFGPWINNFFAHITAQKIVFFIAVAVFIIGVVLYFKGRKAAKKAGEDTPFIPQKITKFVRDTRGEFKKIVWPTFPAVVRNTGITLAVCAMLGLVICLFDAGLSALVDLLLKLGS